MKEKRIKIIYQLLGILAIFLLWLIFSFINNDNFIVPDIPSVFKSLNVILSSSLTYYSFGLTLGRTIMAIIISIVIGLVLGIFSGLFNRFYYFLNPFMKLIRFVPTPCFVYIFIILFLKNPNLASVILTILVILPIIYQSVADGFRNIDENIIMCTRLEGLYHFNSIFKALLPQVFPYLFIAIINSVGLGVKISIMSEIIIGNNNIYGIGRLIYDYNQNSDFASLFAILLIIVILFTLLDLILGTIKTFFKKIYNF